MILWGIEWGRLKHSLITSATNPPPAVKQMNEEEKRKVENEGNSGGTAP
jgi:hypothetical protein